MNLICQKEALDNIKILAKHQQHGLLIVGDSGSGKTYVARKYANYLGIPDFYIINPVMADLKSMIDECIRNTNPVVLCIENLDSGVIQASYPLLKLIEDCPNHIYIVVTCCNLYSIPDTIPSRCALVSINPPTRLDIEQYAQSKDMSAYLNLHDTRLWGCIKSFGDVDLILKFKLEQFNYFEGLRNINWTKDTVSNISWKLQHYEDKTETPLSLIIRYLMQYITTDHQKSCLDCLNDLSDGRISKNAIVSKLVFDLKYTR